MRDLKAVYNRLVDEKVLPYNAKLFDDVYTKVESQTKRALEKEQMNTLMYADFEKLPKGVQCALAYFFIDVPVPGDAVHRPRPPAQAGCEREQDCV